MVYKPSLISSVSRRSHLALSAQSELKKTLSPRTRKASARLFSVLALLLLELMKTTLFF